jgi:hypothetical protein
VLAGSLALSGYSANGGEGRWDDPTLNTAGAGSGSTASSATTPAASAGASGTTSAGAVTG